MNNNETKMGDVRVKAIIESLLFVNERPIELNELIQITEAGKKDIELAIEELISEYATRNSGICIVKIAGGYQMCSCPDNETWVKKMYQERSKRQAQ